MWPYLPPLQVAPSSPQSCDPICPRCRSRPAPPSHVTLSAPAAGCARLPPVMWPYPLPLQVAHSAVRRRASGWTPVRWRSSWRRRAACSACCSSSCSSSPSSVASSRRHVTPPLSCPRPRPRPRPTASSSTTAWRWLRSPTAPPRCPPTRRRCAAVPRLAGPPPTPPRGARGGSSTAPRWWRRAAWRVTTSRCRTARSTRWTRATARQRQSPSTRTTRARQTRRWPCHSVPLPAAWCHPPAASPTKVTLALYSVQPRQRR